MLCVSTIIYLKKKNKEYLFKQFLLTVYYYYKQDLIWHLETTKKFLIVLKNKWPINFNLILLHKNREKNIHLYKKLKIQLFNY